VANESFPTSHIALLRMRRVKARGPVRGGGVQVAAQWAATTSESWLVG